MTAETIRVPNAEAYRDDQLRSGAIAAPAWRSAARQLWTSAFGRMIGREATGNPALRDVGFDQLGNDAAVIRRAYDRLDSIAKRVADELFSDRNDYLVEIYELLRESIRDASLLLSGAVSSSCAVTLKVIWADDRGDVAIANFIRDPDTEAVRSHYLPPDKFAPKQNTAFEKILYHQSEVFYTADNLIALEARGEYRNSNPYWKDFYNSTAVAPIYNRFRNSYVGFLCADTKSGSLANKSVSSRVRNILDGFAEMMYYAIRAANDCFGAIDKQIGWSVSNDGPRVIDRDAHADLQSTFKLMEALFLHSNPTAMRNRLLPASRVDLSASHYPLGVRSMDNDEAVALGLTWDDVSDPELLALREKSTLSEFIETLEEIAPFDKYASELLAKAKSAE